MAELRYWLILRHRASAIRRGRIRIPPPSHVHIAERDLTTAFNFGSQAAAGVTFGDNGRYELSALIHHASNASIK